MRRCVWYRNLENEEAMARVGPQRHEGGGEVMTTYLPPYVSPQWDSVQHSNWQLLRWKGWPRYFPSTFFQIIAYQLSSILCYTLRPGSHFTLDVSQQKGRVQWLLCHSVKSTIQKTPHNKPHDDECTCKHNIYLSAVSKGSHLTPLLAFCSWVPSSINSLHFKMHV